jgi:hypothetical protein
MFIELLRVNAALLVLSLLKRWINWSGKTFAIF